MKDFDNTDRNAAETARSRLAAIVESSDDAIIGKDLNGIITSWNKGAEKIFGYTAEEMVGTSIVQLFPPERQAEEDFILGKIRRGEKVEQFETLRQTKDGRLINILVTASPIKDAVGNIVGASKIARDITLQKQHEQEILRLSRLYCALSHINQAIVWTRQRDELFEKICRVLVEFGKFSMAWIGQADADTWWVKPVARWGDKSDYLSKVKIYMDERPEGRGPVGSAIREGKSYICNDFAQDPKTLPWHELAKQAGFRAMAAFPIRESGTFCGAVMVYSEEIGFFRDREIALLEEAASDVSFALEFLRQDEKRREAEATLRASEERYRALFERSLDCVFLCDFDGKFLDANQAALNLLGYQRKNITTLTFASLLTADQLPLAFQVMEEIIASGHQKHPTEFRVRARDGRLVYVETQSSLIYHEGKPYAIQGIARDLTERKRAEDLLLASEQRLNSFFTSAPAGLVLLDTELRYVKLNDTAAGINGVSMKDHLGKTVREVLPKFAPVVEPLLHQVLTTGKPILNVDISGEKPHRPGVLQHLTESFFPILGENGRPEGIGIIFVETTERKRLETEVALRERRLNAFFTNSPAGLALLDKQLRYMQLNETVAKINGVPLKDHLGKTVREVLPKFADAAEPLLQKVLATGEPLLNIELSGETPSHPGVLRHWLETFFPTFGEDGRPDGIGVIFVETTGQKQAEMELRESEEKFSRIFESSPMAMALSTLDEGRYLDVNPEFLKMLQRTRDEVVGHTALELGVWVNPEQRNAHIARLTERGALRSIELEIRGKLGLATQILWSAERVIIGGKDCLLGSLMDITERKRAEEEIRWKTAFLEAQLDSSLDGILVVDSQGRTIQQNQRLNKLWKIPPAIAASKDDRVQIEFAASRTKNPVQFTAKVAYLYSHPDEVSRDEIELVDGTILDRYSSPVRNQAGNYYGRIWTFRDITEQRKLEAQFRQSQKMEAFGQLAGGVAHDFNNILAVIQLQAAMLKSEPNLSLQQLEFAGDIEKAAERAANLTRQLLLFSRKQTMQPRNLKLKDVVDNMTKMLQRTLGEKIELKFKFTEEPLAIHADPGMVDQILLNLAVNARDAMPKGGQIVIETSAAEFDEVTAKQTSQARPGLFVCLSVSDTGCGISPEILPRIFEPFFTTKEVGKGTGLGLATVFGIVQQHQGWINVYSEVGRGTTFRVYLPRQTKLTDTEFFWSSHVSQRGGSETILLVEDEFAVRLTVRTTLSRLGYRVLEAANGEEALAVWKQHHEEIRLMLTDLVMPGEVNGKELADQLLQQNPKLKIIYASGYSEEVAGKDLRLEEGVNFLAKPFQAYKLVQTIRNQLDSSA
jgi:PAS domain S-box-containing protein